MRGRLKVNGRERWRGGCGGGAGGEATLSAQQGRERKHETRQKERHNTRQRRMAHTQRESTSGGATAASPRARSGINFITLKNGISPSLFHPGCLFRSKRRRRAGACNEIPRVRAHTQSHTLSLSLSKVIIMHHASSSLHLPSVASPPAIPKSEQNQSSARLFTFPWESPTHEQIFDHFPPPPLRTDFHVRSRGHRGRGRPSPISLYFLPRSQPTRTDSDPSLR